MARWRIVGGIVGAVAVVMIAVVAVVRLQPADHGAEPFAAGAWVAMPSSGLAGRSGPSVVWTRKAMIVWGGAGEAGVLGDGAAYDLSTQTWKPLPPAPISARQGHTAVWTGNRMLVYGGVGLRDGCDRPCALGDGAAYDPVANAWTPLAPPPLEARSGQTAVYFQNRMVVWGGAGEGGAALADGASYDPVADSWTVLPPSPLAPRVSHRSVATTHRMLVWGGSSEAAEGGMYFADGAVYSPATNSWTRMASPPNWLAGRDNFASVWDGQAMLVWGGFGRSDTCTPCFDADGAAYDLDTDTWRRMAPSPLSGRGGHRAVWTGRDMLVWGGFDTVAEGDGALYNPTDDTWARVSAAPLPARQAQAMVWTGQQLLIWGGQGADAKLSDGAVLTLTAA